jgi:hypothetical protein
MSLRIRVIAAAAAGLSLGACTVNNPPAAVATTPAPVVVQQPAPSAGTVVVQPRTY